MPQVSIRGLRSLVEPGDLTGGVGEGSGDVSEVDVDVKPVLDGIKGRIPQFPSETLELAFSGETLKVCSN